MDKKKVRKTDRRKLICSELASAIRKLQQEHILAKEVRPHGDLTSADLLCNALEAVFLHELKNNKGQLWRDLKRPNAHIPPEPSFWTFIDPLVSDELKMQLQALRNSESDVRKCRSWVRLVLSKDMILQFLEDLQRHPGLLAFHYGGDAVLRDLEQSEVIAQLLKGLSVLQLEFDHTGSNLNTWEVEVLNLAGIWEPPERMRTLESRSQERISPPASDFDFEGVSIIDLALNKYSKKKESLDCFTDSQLITSECLERMSQTSETTSGGSLSDLEADLPVGSYGAMLRSYARRSGTSKSSVSSRHTPTRHSATPGEISPVPVPEMQRRRTASGLSNGSVGARAAELGELSLATLLDYEVVPTTEGGKESDLRQQQLQAMSALLTTLVNEKGLDSQNYLCRSCNRPIGVIFGLAKLCKFNGHYYCFDCHSDDERVIPARVLFNWDFKKYKVCHASAEFLDSVERTPLLNLQEVNKALYMYIPQLEEALKLRQQLKSLKDYIMTCKNQEASEHFMKKVRSSHLYENEHLYSLHDLREVNSRDLNEILKKAMKFGKKHIRECPLCSQKGFICEMCHSDQVIYPFDLDETYQCPSCNALFHRGCWPRKGKCPKCVRIQRRRAALLERAADA